MDTLLIIIIGVILIGILNTISELQSEIARTNAVLDKIAKQIGVPDTDINDELKNLIAKGNTIEAVKIYRKFAGVGLKESKEYIDSLGK